jgi:hypothetical protein
MDENDCNIYIDTAPLNVIQYFELCLNFLTKFQRYIRSVRACDLQNIIHKQMYLVVDFIVNKFEENNCY